MNYYLLLNLILQLQNKISGSSIIRIISPSKNIFYLILSDSREKEQYCLEFYTGKNPYIFMKENFSVPSKNVSDLLTDMYGQTISSVSIKNEDKIIELKLSSEVEMLISFVNLKENIFVLRNGVIGGSLKNSKDAEGKRIDEIIPPLSDQKPITEDEISLKEYFRSIAPKMGNEVFVSILESLQLKPDMVISMKAADAVKEKIDESVNKLKKSIDKPEPGLYLKDGKLIPSVFPLNENIFRLIKKFEDVNSLVAGYSHELYKLNVYKEVKEKKEKELLKKISLTEKSIKSLENQLNEALNSIRYKKAGDEILSNLHSIFAGDSEYSFTNENGEQEKIKLKTELSPADNAQFYYEKYKKQRASSGTIKDKMVKMEKEKLNVEKELEELRSVTEIKKLKKMDKNFKKEDADETSRFRKFVISSGAEVWVGKDSASNDMLTTRYSAQNDLWFHVRGFSGSHTVLKMTDKNSNPPSELVKIAAAIAAYYSKARNGGNVPVAYTERKYVKKKKGFKEGSVVMEREKVVFVKPKLPDQG